MINYYFRHNLKPTNTLLLTKSPQAFDIGPFTPMQLSGFIFLLPTFKAYCVQDIIGIIILITLIITTLIVHRPAEIWQKLRRDYIDDLIILLLGLHNGIIMLVMWKESYTILAILSVVITYFLDCYRRTLIFRSNQRDLIHVLMHFSGALGTFCIL